MLESASNKPAAAPIPSPSTDAPSSLHLSLGSGPQTLQELQVLQAKIQEQMMILQKGLPVTLVASSSGANGMLKSVDASGQALYQTVVEDPHALSPYPTQAVAPQPTTRHRPVAPKQPGMSIPLIDPLFFAQGQFLVPGYAPMMPMAGMGNGQEWARAAGAYQQSNGVMGAPVPNGQINMQRVISQNGYFVSAPFANTGPQQMMLVPQPAVAKVPQKSMKSAGMPSTNRNVASSPGQIMRPDPKRRNSDFRTQIEAVTSQEGAADPATQAHSSRDKAQVARTDTENMRIHYSRMDLNDSAHVATSSPRESERMDTSESISSSSAAGNVSAEVSSSSSTNNIPAAAQIVSETSRILSQNLARLAFLVRQMETPTGYEVACKELVAWCDDQRAYAPSLCGDLNHTFEKVFENSFLDGFNMLFGLQVLKVAIKYLDSMHPSAAENIKEWILVMEGFMKAQGVGKARILSEKQTMGTRSLIRQGELTSISRACIQNIMTCEAMQRQALVSRGNRPIATKQQKQTLSSGSQILVSNQVKNVEGRPVASKYPRWVENSIEPFALLPEATHVDVSFGMSAERVKFFTSESPAAIEYKLHMTVYNKDDITKRHVWPPSLQSVDLNSFRLNLQRKMYVGGPQGRYRTTGYDIPLDLSVYLKMGTNVLRIQLRPDVLQKEYVVQIEVVVLLTKKQAFDCVTGRQFLDEATTIQQDDEDIQVIQDHYELDLRCPLSLKKAEIPVKGRQCSHFRCFDLNTWFDCHDKARSFSCPLCSKSLTVDELVIDKFVQSILKQTKQNIVSVLLSPNGNWTAVVPADEGNSAKRKNALGSSSTESMAEVSGSTAAEKTSTTSPTVGVTLAKKSKMSA